MAQEEQEGANPPTMCLMVLPGPYNGESSWTNWHEHFKSVAAVNRWKDGEILLWLRVWLAGRVAMAFKKVKASVVVARAIVCPGSNHEVYISVINPTPDIATLYKGTKVAILESVSWLAFIGRAI